MTDREFSTPLRVPVPADGSRAARVAAEAARIDLTDRAGMNAFGKDAQRRAADCAELALQRMRRNDVDHVRDLLGRIIAAVSALDVKAALPGNFITKYFMAGQRHRRNTAAEFFANADRIDIIAIEIQKTRDRLLHDIAFFDELHRETCATLEDLEICIEAGRRIAGEQPRLSDAASAAQESLGQDAVMTGGQNRALAIDRLQRRLLQLDQVRHVLLQHLPQIRIVQHGDETLLDNLEAALTLTIPLWKQRVAILLGLTRQKDAMAMERGVAEATNRLMIETGDLLHSQSVEIQQMSGRGIIDVAVLESTNRKLIETIEELLALQQNSARNRQECHDRMAVSSTELRHNIDDMTRGTHDAAEQAPVGTLPP